MSIAFRNCRTEVPAEGSIDYNHPLGAHLTSLWLPGHIRLLTGQAVTYAGTLHQVSSGPYGRAALVTGNTKATWPDPFPSGTVQRGSFAVICRVIGTPATEGFAVGAGTNTNDRWGVNLPYGDGTLYFDIGAASAVSVGALSYGGWDVWVFTNGPVNGAEVWRNGLSVASAAESSNTRAVAGSFGIGQNGSENTTNDALVSLVATWGRELTVSEIASLVDEPFAMLKPY